MWGHFKIGKKKKKKFFLETFLDIRKGKTNNSVKIILSLLNFGWYISVELSFISLKSKPLFYELLILFVSSQNERNVQDPRNFRLRLSSFQFRTEYVVCESMFILSTILKMLDENMLLSYTNYQKLWTKLWMKYVLKNKCAVNMRQTAMPAGDTTKIQTIITTIPYRCIFRFPPYSGPSGLS